MVKPQTQADYCCRSNPKGLVGNGIRVLVVGLIRDDRC